MKESPKRYTNPFLSDEENEKVNLWKQELDLTKNCEDDKLRKSLLPSELSEKETEIYTDKNVLECELPELLACYKDGAFHVKDICVDEGIHHEKRILFDESNNEMLKPEQLKFSTMEDYYMESNLCSAVLEPSNDHMNTGDNHDEMTERKSDASCGTQEVDHNNDTEIPVQDLQNSIPDHRECGIQEEVIFPNELKEISEDDSKNGVGITEYAPDRLMFSSESDAVLMQHEKKINSSDILLDIVSTEQIVSNSGPSLQQDRPLPSLKSLLESIDQHPSQSPVEEISKKSVENENGKPATSSERVQKIENLERVDELSIEQHGAPKVQEMGLGSDNAATVNPVHHGEGESSFSVAGPVSGLITYSGPIVFSGSTSIRSDSSTTSTRSFAFPILQNEWNSSPVRMAKADRRRLKHRGWRHGLLCCRF